MKIICCLYVVFAIQAYFSNINIIGIVANQENDIIVINKEDNTPSGQPRTTVYNPFFASLMNGYVNLGSNSSYGDVDVDLTSTAGDYYSTVFDTNDGMIAIPISGLPGDYILTLTTEGNLTFIGRFTI